MRRRSPHQHGGDRGSADLAISLAVCFFLLMLIVQVGTWAHAQHRAQAIAEQTLSALRAADATTATGTARAEQATTDLGGELLRHTTVEVERGTATARVEVQAVVRGPIPGWAPPVHAELSAPVETTGEAR